MDFSLEVNAVGYNIRAYGPGQITLNVPRALYEGTDELGIGHSPWYPAPQKEVLKHSAIIMPQHLQRNWPPQQPHELVADHVAMIANLQPEVVILGTGAQRVWPDTAALAPLIQAGIGYEVMDTPAACRTYNVLMADGRRVAAGLLMI